jgi:hypothetical protein
MELALFFFIGIPALVVTGVLLGPGLLQRLSAWRILAAAERTIGMRRTGRLRIGVATAIGWTAATTPMMAVSPAAGVWLGGAVVAAGASWIIMRSADAFAMDDHAFDVAVRELLDQA